MRAVRLNVLGSLGRIRMKAACPLPLLKLPWYMPHGRVLLRGPSFFVAPLARCFGGAARRRKAPDIVRPMEYPGTARWHLLRWPSAQIFFIVADDEKNTFAAFIRGDHAGPPLKEIRF